MYYKMSFKYFYEFIFNNLVSLTAIAVSLD